MIENRLQDRVTLQRSKLQPVVNQAVENLLAGLSVCPDFVGTVREEVEPIIVAVVRFLARCQDAQEGGPSSHTSYLFKPDALEADLHQDLAEWFKALGLYGLNIEVQHIAGGRIDLMFSFDAFRFVLELKREIGDGTRTGIAKYLRQAGSYQATDIAVGMLIVLDLTAPALPPHLRDNVWIEVLDATSPEGVNRYLAVVRIPGNRKKPSSLS